MVCEKCELKLKHVATSDPYRMQGNTFKLNLFLDFLKYFILFKITPKINEVEHQEDEK